MAFWNNTAFFPEMAIVLEALFASMTKKLSVTRKHKLAYTGTSKYYDLSCLSVLKDDVIFVPYGIIVIKIDLWKQVGSTD